LAPALTRAAVPEAGAPLLIVLDVGGKFFRNHLQLEFLRVANDRQNGGNADLRSDESSGNMSDAKLAGVQQH